MMAIRIDKRSNQRRHLTQQTIEMFVASLIENSPIKQGVRDILNLDVFLMFKNDCMNFLYAKSLPGQKSLPTKMKV